MNGVLFMSITGLQEPLRIGAADLFCSSLKREVKDADIAVSH